MGEARPHISRGQVVASLGLEAGGAPRVEGFASVVTDSRKVAPGDLFVALEGDRFDGHAFVEEALRRGAAGVVVAKPVPDALRVAYRPEEFRVPDTLEALGRLAAGWRSRFAAPVGVLTGSNGKTTTKEMTLAILRLRFSTLWSPGNYNNRIGLPLTLLGLGPTHERVLLEMGMNEPGEIRALTRIATPDVGALLNIGPAHVERFGSLEAVAAAKGEMLEALPGGSVFIYNRDDPRVSTLAETWQGPSLSFGSGPACDVRLREVEPEGWGHRVGFSLHGEPLEVTLRVPGRHNVHNALAAAALASALGCSAEEAARGLAGFDGVRGRFSVRACGRFTLVDDTYNANPASMQAAFDNLASLAAGADKVLVLGDMLELGTWAPEAHRELGRSAASLHPALLCVTGGFAGSVVEGAAAGGLPADRLVRFEDPDEAAEHILARCQGGEWVLVKGSRGMALERVVEALEQREGRIPRQGSGR